MSLDSVRLAALARSLKKAASVLIFAALVLLQGVSQATAAASNGSLITAFVTDELCLAGPYKNSETADLYASFSATTGGPGEIVWVGIWNSVINDMRLTVTTPAGSTTAAASGAIAVKSSDLVGDAAYLYLRASFTDAGDGRTNATPPLSPTDVSAGGGGNYHQTPVDMSQDPDCIPRPEVQLEFNGAVSSGPATALNGRDFGDVPLQSGPVTHTFTLRSIGISPVNVSQIKVTAGSGFTVSSSLGAISNTGDFTVSFDPSTGGAATAQLDIVSDAVSGTISVPLTGNGQVAALGSVIIRQETDGDDAVFGFSSSTSDLNLSLATSGGRGESAVIPLAAGTYSVTADDMSGAGFGLTGMVCSDDDSTIDTTNRTANIVLAVGEALVCTFTSVQSGEKTSRLIEDFLITRAELILANQPDIQRRIDRLNGVAPAGGNPVAALMGYLPGIVEGSPLTVSTSLSAIDRLAGNEASGSFDMWLEGTFALFDAGGPDGTFNTASLGADYLVTPDLLIGGFVQVDHLTQSSSLDPSTISGTGWLVGPYATARLNENLYLDVLAAAGASSNQVSPYGTYEDGFDATRWLLSASLQGQWQWDNWTFGPRARVSYFEETTKAYTDTLGVGISSITAGLGQIAVGPAISYRYTTEGNVVIDTGLRFEGIADILKNSTASGFDNLHARIEGTIDVSLPGGEKLGLSSAFDGIGGDTGTATSAKIKVSLPIK